MRQSRGKAAMSAVRELRPGKLSPQEAELRRQQCTEAKLDVLMVQRMQLALQQHERHLHSKQKGLGPVTAVLFLVLLAVITCVVGCQVMVDASSRCCKCQ